MRDCEFVRPDNLGCFVNTNEMLLGPGGPRGIVLEFPGLGGGSCLGGTMDMTPYADPYAKALADAGLLLMYEFSGPWSWMNRGAVRLADLTVDAARAKFGLAENTPLIATGGSMGGLGGLIYAADSRHKVTACAVTCPCLDPFELLERKDFPDFPRTLLTAVAAYEAPLEEALATVSPVGRVKDMPDIPYLIMADEDDELCLLSTADRYVEALRQKFSPANPEYIVMEHCGHGGFTPAARQRFTEFVAGQ